jgi:hypothetical protein
MTQMPPQFAFGFGWPRAHLPCKLALRRLHCAIDARPNPIDFGVSSHS